mmetsp:Transcript_80288/g.225686  ORF Transcript_80288/g.225686 Transcript_80288/m.225686 type:complete len:323 (-) Transcript_80288:36-1004(-)
MVVAWSAKPILSRCCCRFRFPPAAPAPSVAVPLEVAAAAAPTRLTLWAASGTAPCAEDDDDAAATARLTGAAGAALAADGAGAAAGAAAGRPPCGLDEALDTLSAAVGRVVHQDPAATVCQAREVEQAQGTLVALDLELVHVSAPVHQAPLSGRAHREPELQGCRQREGAAGGELEDTVDLRLGRAALGPVGVPHLGPHARDASVAEELVQPEEEVRAHFAQRAPLSAPSNPRLHLPLPGPRPKVQPNASPVQSPEGSSNEVRAKTMQGSVPAHADVDRGVQTLPVQCRLGNRNDLVGIGSRCSQRLLQNDVLAGAERTAYQ